MPLDPILNRLFQDWDDDLVLRQLSPATVAKYRTALRQFQQWLEHQPTTLRLADLSVPLCVEYVQTLAATELHHHTILDYIAVIVQWVAFLVGEGELTQGLRNERGKPSSPERLRTRLEALVPRRIPAAAPTIPDLRDLLDYYPDALTHWLAERQGHIPAATQRQAHRVYLSFLRNRALITTLFSSGGRINEVLGLQRDQVQLGAQVRYAVNVVGKGRKQRPLRLDEDAQDALQQYLAARQGMFMAARAVFISHGPRGAGAQLTDWTGWKVVTDAATAVADQWQRAGVALAEVDALRNVTPHSIRHFFAQHLLREGAELADISAILGHSSTTVTEQVYARKSATQLLEISDTYSARRKRRPREPLE